MSQGQGYFEPVDTLTGKAPEHVKNALKGKNNISNAEVVPAVNLQKSCSKRKSKGYWTEENTIIELKLVIKELGYFPTESNLRNINRQDLASAINKNGGYPKLRKILGYKLKRKANHYWSDEKIINELKLMIQNIGDFPTESKLIKMKNHSLNDAIKKHGGIVRFRRLLGYKLIQKPDGYWNEEKIIYHLKPIIKKLNHFPTQRELTKINRADLSVAITRNNGSNYFRELLGYELLEKPKNFWDIEKTIVELEHIIKELGHFPSATELCDMKKSTIIQVMHKNGGFNYFKDLMGFDITIREEFTSKISSYLRKRGKKSEDFVKEIITEWSNIHGKPSPDFNVKLAKGNVLEFVCNSNKKVGIDVTNTKASKNSTINTIRRKWKHKDYYLYLDEFWIVVFTDVLNSEDYDRLNTMCPDSVKIFSIEGFLKELDYSAEQCNTNEICKLQRCTFHNKDGMIDINKVVGE